MKQGGQPYPPRKAIVSDHSNYASSASLQIAVQPS